MNSFRVSVFGEIREDTEIKAFKFIMVYIIRENSNFPSEASQF